MVWQKIWKGKENSFVSDMFEGAMLSNITCLNCKHEASFFEKFGDLTLDIHRQMSMN